MNTSLYPQAPAGVSPQAIAPSAAFKQQASKVIVSIILFFIVYLALMLAATALAAACVYAGVWLIISAPRFITIALGIGAMAVGVSVLYFLVKFIFAVSKTDNTGRVEITETEQPALFAFIRRLTEETQTQFPKKIFVSSAVNACVFYNSSFWSMFFPVRKNLEIGLGLVNTTNISEFKAIMAHEFGHFSQRSMKLGSFTYNVNRVIYNILYDNNSYNNFLNTFASIDGIFALFAILSARIAQGIQAILRGMYGFINKNYMGLSREMEFHADAIAASVAGGNNVISGLSRLDLAQSSYNEALEKADEWLPKKKITRNIFSNQLSIMQNMATRLKLPLQQGIPVVDYQTLQTLSKSRINYKDQWASHPTLEERKTQLDLLNIHATPDETAAWAIFTNVQALQEKLTTTLYRNVTLGNTEVFDATHFEEELRAETEKYTLPAAYNGFYNNRYINSREWHLQTLANNASEKSFDQLFSTENAEWHHVIRNNESDLAIVKAIKEKQIAVKTFDFNGVKYTQQEADQVIELLDKEINEAKQTLEQLDKEAYVYFLRQQPALPDLYTSWNAFATEHDGFVTTIRTIFERINPFYTGDCTIEQVNSIVNELKTVYEPSLKKLFKSALEQGIINADIVPRVQTFIDSHYSYFMNDAFRNEELNEMTALIREVAKDWDDRKYIRFKELVTAQLEGVAIVS